MKTELRIADHSIFRGHHIFEVWHDGQFIAQVTGADVPGVRVISKHELEAIRAVDSLAQVVEVKIGAPITRPAIVLSKEYLKEMSRLVEACLPDNHGYILLAFPFGEGLGQRLYYTSNAQRKDAIAALKEFLIKASGPEEWLQHIK